MQSASWSFLCISTFYQQQEGLATPINLINSSKRTLYLQEAKHLLENAISDRVAHAGLLHNKPQQFELKQSAGELARRLG
jgi:hypothetical protein